MLSGLLITQQGTITPDRIVAAHAFYADGEVHNSTSTIHGLGGSTNSTRRQSTAS
jgi:hypothetical protein